MTIPAELLEKYGMAEKEKYVTDLGEFEGSMLFYRTFLYQTDHIPNKITEGLIEELASASLTEFISAFIQFIAAIRGEYQEILVYRKQARSEINRLENHEEEIL